MGLVTRKPGREHSGWRPGAKVRRLRWLVPIGTAFTLIAIMTSAPSAGAANPVSQATANGILVSLGGGAPLLPGESAVNNGSPATVTQTNTGGLGAIPTLGLSNTTVYSQTAIANNDGTSAACAGLVGQGGALVIGNGGTCTPTGTTGPAVIDLTSALLAAIPGLPALPAGSVELEFSAIYGVCTAAKAGSSTGFSAASTIADAKLVVSLPSITLPGIGTLPGLTETFPLNASQSFTGLPAPLSGLINVKLNQTVQTGPTTSATALDLTLLGGSALHLAVGAVTCGPNDVPAAVTTTTAAPATTAAAQTSPTEAALSGIQTDEGRYVGPRSSSTDWLFWGGLATVSLLVLGGIVPLELRRRAHRR